MLVDAMRLSRTSRGAAAARWALPLGVLAGLAAALLMLLPAPARAGCGGVERARPRKHVNPGGKAPLAIGDSVMLLAIPDLARSGYKVNARGCRQWSEGLGVLRYYKRHRRLPHLVVMALGADWVITGQDVRRTLHVMGKKRVLGLVVPRELGGGTSHDADAVRHAWRAHQKRVVLLDWVRYGKGHPSWFQPDGLHLTFTGAGRFARLLAKALPFAIPGEFPRGAHYPR
jgi:hypothetical protein